MTEKEVPVVKDEENERPIPTVWRAIFIDIINAFVKKDYLHAADLDSVSPVSNETADHIKEYIEDYGEKLIQLPEETWESSICIWRGVHWDVLVDLWTSGEGRSDLVLGARVSESDDGYIFHIDMVYVP